MDIAILSNVNLDSLIRQLNKTHHVFEPQGYGQWTYYCFDPDESLRAFHPQAIFLLLDGNAMMENCVGYPEGKKEIQENMMKVRQLLERFSENPIFVSTIDVRKKRIFANAECRYEELLCAEWRNELSAAQEAHKNCYLFDLREIIMQWGKRTFYSDKMWYLGSVPYSYQAMEILEQEVADALERIGSVSKKVLVLDLDNTLWGGVVGEEGALGITLGNSLLGALYQDVQKRILEIKNCGILLAVVSKNNQEIVDEVFEKNPAMVLKKEDFAKVCVGWEDKSRYIAQIAQELNLGLDSFVFLDDNPVEREAVRIALPEVNVVEFPEDVAELPQCVDDIYKHYFWKRSLTDEDKQKTRQYQQELKRQAQKNTFESIDDYIRSLEICITIRKYHQEYGERVVQLVNKTNQFNTTTLRMNQQEVTQYSNDSNQDIFMVFARDRFGDNGMIGLAFVRRDGTTAFFDNFLMSCRVMGRKIEETVFSVLEDYLIEMGLEKAVAYYVASPKNKPVENLWGRLGYERIEQDAIRDTYAKLLERQQGAELMDVEFQEN